MVLRKLSHGSDTHGSDQLGNNIVKYNTQVGNILALFKVAIGIFVYKNRDVKFRIGTSFLRLRFDYFTFYFHPDASRELNFLNFNHFHACHAAGTDFLVLIRHGPPAFY